MLALESRSGRLDKERIVEIKGDALTKSQGSEDVWSLRFPVFMQFRGLEPGEKI